jgi:hypothetical protein
MRISLLISAALNLLLITTIVAARVDQSRATVDLDLPARSSPVVDSMRWRGQPDSLADLHAHLAAAGLSERVIKPLALGWLVAVEGDRVSFADDTYWRGDWSPARSNLGRQIAIEEGVRAALLAFYGPAAESDPAFDTMFRPLGPSFSFLSSEQQLLLQQGQAEPLAAGNTRANGRCARIGSGDAQGERARAPGAEILAGLGETGRYEYLVRFSPLAAQIRQSGVAADEAEFRHVFDLMHRSDTAGSPAEHLELRRTLRVSLGNVDFDRLWAMLDPFHAEIERHLRAEGFDAGEIAAAYGVINQSQDALLEALGRGPSQVDLIDAAAAERQRELTRLTSLLGEPAAERLLAKQAELAMRLSAGDTPVC